MYVRISEDRAGKRAGVERQLADCRQWCAGRGWEVVSVYEDNDRSAYSGKPRPEYLRLQQAVAAGELDAVVAWHTDRLWRNVVEKETFLALAKDGGLTVILAGTTEIDPTDSDDQFLSTILTAAAVKESANISRRQKGKMRELAVNGMPHGGSRPYGYRFNDEGNYVIDRDEAKVIREVAKRMLRGEAGNSIVLDLMTRGITTTNGKNWRVDTLHDLMVRPVLAGLRVHHDEIYPGKWKPILTVEQHEQLKAMAAARSRAVREQRATRAPRVNLLTGLLRCGKCGTPLHAGNTGTKRIYCCPSKSMGGCGGIKIGAEDADMAALQKVWDYITDGEFASGLAAMQAAAAKDNADIAAVVEQLETDRTMLNTLSDDHYDGIIDKAQYVRQSARLRDRIAANEAALERFTAINVSVSMTPSQVARQLEAASLQEKRNTIVSVVKHFAVLPAPKPINVAQPMKRLQPVWALAHPQE